MNATRESKTPKKIHRVFIGYVPFIDRYLCDLLKTLNEGGHIEAYYVVGQEFFAEGNVGKVVDPFVAEALIKCLLGKGAYVKVLDTAAILLLKARIDKGERLVISTSGNMLAQRIVREYFPGRLLY